MNSKELLSQKPEAKVVNTATKQTFTVVELIPIVVDILKFDVKEADEFCFIFELVDARH